MTTAQTPTLTIAEAAARLQVSPKTVRQRIKRGELPAHLVEGPHGPEYRLPAAGLENQRPVGNTDSESVFPRGYGNGQATLNGTLETGGKGTLEADSSPLNPQARRAGQGTLNGTLEGAAGMTWYPREHDHRADLAEQKAALLESENGHLRAQLEHRAAEAERSSRAEHELRQLLLASQTLAAQLAHQLEQKALPPAPEEKPKVRWWRIWR